VTTTLTRKELDEALREFLIRATTGAEGLAPVVKQLRRLSDNRRERELRRGALQLLRAVEQSWREAWTSVTESNAQEARTGLIEDGLLLEEAVLPAEIRTNLSQGWTGRLASSLAQRSPEFGLGDEESLAWFYDQRAPLLQELGAILDTKRVKSRKPRISKTNRREGSVSSLQKDSKSLRDGDKKLENEIINTWELIGATPTNGVAAALQALQVPQSVRDDVLRTMISSFIGSKDEIEVRLKATIEELGKDP